MNITNAPTIIQNCDEVMAALYAVTCSTVSLVTFKAFLVGVISVCLWNVRRLFLEWHGVRHRLCGAIHLILLVVGALGSDADNKQQYYLVHDFILGVSGIVTTLTAAADFPHKLVSNDSEGQYVQSGTLHQKAIVTQVEMIEHSFYQGLNLCQAMYLHAMHHCHASNAPIWVRFFLLWLVTAPWIFRSLFPVSSFSHNWKLHHERQNSSQRQNNTHPVNISWELLMYKVKKAQYIFYKHCILHGINITVLLMPDAPERIPLGRAWRIFWILLNASYVFEFFLQTLVKRSVINQTTMLLFNQLLMFAASLGALVVLKDVAIWIVSLSVAMNFLHRHHDVVNTVGIAIVASFWRQ